MSRNSMFMDEATILGERKKFNKICVANYTWLVNYIQMENSASVHYEISYEIESA